MDLSRLSTGERISSVSAILLFALTFFDWFSSRGSNNSNLLFLIEDIRPGESAWEALSYIPFVLLVTISATLMVSALRLTPEAQLPIRVNAVVAILGIASALLILFRIVDPPTFEAVGPLTYETTVLFPTFLALWAAAGIAFGGFWAMREEGLSQTPLSSSPY
jgi:hypothetical protein